MLLNNPDLSPAQKKVVQAGLNDGKAGRPNRLEGIDIESLALPPIQRTLGQYARDGNLARVIAIASKSNVNDADTVSDPPLHEACSSGHIEVARYLLKLGARVDVADNGSGRYPIHCAASGGNLELFMLLIKAGARIDQKADTPAQTKAFRSQSGLQGLTTPSPQPIHIAAGSGSYSICQYLLKTGIKSDVKDDEGNIPLNYATRNGWNTRMADTIRLFDPKGAVESSFLAEESKFRKVVGPNGSSIRTGGLYLSIFKNTGEYEIKNGGAWVAHCLELREDRSAHFMFYNSEDNHPTAIIRSFRAHSKTGNVYSGNYALDGEKLDNLTANLQSIPEERYKILTGTAQGDTLTLRFMSRSDKTQETFFPSNSDSNKVPGSEFKFYAE